jgi:lysophospholipase L1-like esterase
MSVTGFLVDSTIQKYDYESLENYNTPDFSTSSTYQVGDYVMYQGKLYKCTTEITTSGAWDSTKWSLAILSDDVADLKNKITYGMTLKESVNHSVSDDSWTRGYYIANDNNANGGNPIASSVHSYSDYIQVNTDDVVRLYDYYGGSFGQREMYTITAYDSNKVYIYKNDSVSWRKTEYTVQSGVSYIRISTRNASQYMVTINNNTVTAYEPYYEPYYVAQYKFIDEALSGGELKLSNLKNEYAAALPKIKLRQTVGIAESWYKSSMITPPTELICVNGGYNGTVNKADCVTFPNETASSGNNGYIWYAYDALFNMLYNFDNGTGHGAPMVRQTENLSNCSLLAIGDSTITSGYITGKLLSYFTEKGKTITLLGTLWKSSEPLNKNEGRAGWTTADYMTNSTKNGYTNPFYNSATDGFDFSYYMSQQGYSGVDFVVIQLGINDLYPKSARMPSEPNYESIWENIKTMIDSILGYNSGIKIIINLPTTPNSEPSAHRIPQFLYQHYVIRYNEIALNGIATYSIANVRPSYCHLILDPASDILDNVHPTVTGYEKMAMEVINQINCWQNGV